MTEKWKRDTGILFGLVFLFLGYSIDIRFLFVSGALLLAALFAPILITPVAYFWLKLAEILGFFVNKIFFSLVFFLIITPIGFFRRTILNIVPYGEFGAGLPSAFVERDHEWQKDDLAMPY